MGGETMKWIAKFRDTSYRERLWEDLLPAVFVSPLIFLFSCIWCRYTYRDKDSR